MSKLDLTVPSFLNFILLSLLVGFIQLVFFLKNSPSLRDRFILWLLMKWKENFKDVVLAEKTMLFAPMKDFRSLNQDLRRKGQVRILEIGIGSGANFQFYPKNARVIGVDPNPFFEKTVLENRARFPEMELKIIVGRGEELNEVEDDSVDIVVTTEVLCAIKDLDALTREVHRVLAPSGQFFFMEHTIAYDGPSWQRILQRLANIFWPLIFNGCEVTKDIEGALRSAVGFQDFHSKRFDAVKMPKLFCIFIGPHIYGTARKKKVT